MTDRNRLGMLLFIASEATFFLLLIIAFVVYHQAAGNGAEAAAALDVRRTGLFTVLLLASSVTMWLAVRSGQRGGRAAAAWLAVTIALGGTFLVGQGREYADLVRQDVTISRDLFGTTFFTLTGFHGLHVLVGLVMLAIVLATALLWRRGTPRTTVLETVSLYWHFVDAVWLVVFPVVYLWGRM